MSSGALEILRANIEKNIGKHQYETALFWADKAVSLSNYEPKDVYCLAQCMFFMKQYDRAALLIVQKQFHLKHAAFRYLAAKCYTEGKNFKAALDLIENHVIDSSKSILPIKTAVDPKCTNGIPEDAEMVASLHMLRGDIYRALDIREVASDCYRDALKVDVFCFEAFSRLVENHMLRAEEEHDLIESLSFSNQGCSAEDKNMIKFLYSTKLKKYNKPGLFEIPESLNNFHANLDVATCLAERYYYNGEFQSSFKITEGVLKSDPFHTACLPLHVALLVELKKPNTLFFLAHKLVDRFPDLPISWYAVGCYYLMQPTKQELARRYLLKTTLVDSLYGPAWLAYGHSFASSNDHDQAMAAYFTASQLMKGCHLPFLYIGLEYSVTNNTKLAEKFFSTALEICPDDPHVLHEMGISSYANGDYRTALKYFTKALHQVQELGEEISISEWEPLLNNLGHVHRKLKNYPKALECHCKALTLAPHSAETYSAIGLIYCYMGNYIGAIEYLHRSLGLSHDDAFTTTLLDNIIEELASNDPPVYGGGSVEICSATTPAALITASPMLSQVELTPPQPCKIQLLPTTNDMSFGDGDGVMASAEKIGQSLSSHQACQHASKPTTESEHYNDDDDMDLDESVD